MPTPEISMEYPDAVYEYDAERELAISVIALAMKDYVRSISGLMVGKIKRTSRNSLELVRDECFSFLTGKTEISAHWFHQAGVMYFCPKSLSKPDFADYFYKRLTGQVWDRAKVKEPERTTSPIYLVQRVIRGNKKTISEVKPRLRAKYIKELASGILGRPVSEMTVRRAITGSR